MTATQQALTSGGKPIRAGGRPGRTDPRGSAASRRKRKTWMLNNEQFHHNQVGHDVLCTHCSQPLTFDTVESDRKQPGGSYAISSGNVQPSCRNCNIQRRDNPNWTPPNPVTPKETQ